MCCPSCPAVIVPAYTCCQEVGMMPDRVLRLYLHSTSNHEAIHFVKSIIQASATLIPGSRRSAAVCDICQRDNAPFTFEGSRDAERAACSSSPKAGKKGEATKAPCKSEGGPAHPMREPGQAAESLRGAAVAEEIDGKRQQVANLCPDLSTHPRAMPAQLPHGGPATTDPPSPSFCFHPTTQLFPDSKEDLAAAVDKMNVTALVSSLSPASLNTLLQICLLCVKSLSTRLSRSTLDPPFEKLQQQQRCDMWPESASYSVLAICSPLTRLCCALRDGEDEEPRTRAMLSEPALLEALLRLASTLTSTLHPTSGKGLDSVGGGAPWPTSGTRANAGSCGVHVPRILQHAASMEEFAEALEGLMAAKEEPFNMVPGACCEQAIFDLREFRLRYRFANSSPSREQCRDQVGPSRVAHVRKRVDFAPSFETGAGTGGMSDDRGSREALSLAVVSKKKKKMYHGRFSSLKRGRQWSEEKPQEVCASNTLALVVPLEEDKVNSSCQVIVSRKRALSARPITNNASVNELLEGQTRRRDGKKAKRRPGGWRKDEIAEALNFVAFKNKGDYRAFFGYSSE
eukprot:TRINITY_DN1771_c0_g1_i2.p1 TRINITY_DN1771_c0_g1~~TRINITY_DN1771_c0_g1_i2.p1  ORF type:complete len:571 (-),score=95.26 TRINITY_DN1771_c0_g1_i2:983-2695(-)